ncbi:MAG TPA: type II toxin-antitoxin system death-on-curing family toxin [Candidatus Saccharimonadales bacterium]|nr:type II toxin-antitoxin system death-on-curing family toxin [Candidatus Saccharimonadales bacterium]
MMYLTLEQLLALHVLAIEQFGGSDGLRDLGRLESALASQRQEVFGEELYQGTYEKAAALCRGIIGGHPFADGNKRTAMLAALTFLEINGLEFVAEPGELEDFAVQVAVEHLDVPVIAAWLRAHSKKL